MADKISRQSRFWNIYIICSGGDRVMACLCIEVEGVMFMATFKVHMPLNYMVPIHQHSKWMGTDVFLFPSPYFARP